MKDRCLRLRTFYIIILFLLEVVNSYSICQIDSLRYNEIFSKNLSITEFDKFRIVDENTDGLSSLLNLNSEVQKPIKKENILRFLRSNLLNTKGNLLLGYSYGLNTIFTDTTRAINSIFNIGGGFQTKVLGIPLDVSFQYSNLKIPLGANNYFRIALDKDAWIRDKKDKWVTKIHRYAMKDVNRLRSSVVL